MVSAWIANDVALTCWLLVAGKLNGLGPESIPSLLKLMSRIYVPAVSSNSTWPDRSAV